MQRLLPADQGVSIAGNARIFRPDFPGGPPAMFMRGNDERAKKLAAEILDAFSKTVGMERSRLLEPLAMMYYSKTRAGNRALTAAEIIFPPHIRAPAAEPCVFNELSEKARYVPKNAAAKNRKFNRMYLSAVSNLSD